MNESENTKVPHVATLMNHLWDGGVEHFIEEGSRKLGQEDPAGLFCRIPEVREKIDALRRQHARLGNQLLFLANFIDSEFGRLTEKVRNETAFALFYAVKEMDLLPDHTPGVGHLDDAAVTETVLARHAGVFERHCAMNRLDWGALQPDCES
jgi:uncharacterized membrane protein YkvA (DUF1232 family)